MTGSFVEVARRVKRGAFVAEPLRLGMAEKIVDLVLNPGLSDGIPSDVMAELDRLGSEIRQGRLTVPRGNF